MRRVKPPSVSFSEGKRKESHSRDTSDRLSVVEKLSWANKSKHKSPRLLKQKKR